MKLCIRFEMQIDKSYGIKDGNETAIANTKNKETT